MRAALFCFVFSTVSLLGCGGEASDPVESMEQAVKPSGCGDTPIICASGTHLECKGHRASCVPDNPCRRDTDCRLFDSYCGACECFALSVNPDPVCDGTLLECSQPCGGLVAVCQSGRCVATSAAP